MADNSSKNGSSFWSDLNERQRDMRVSFFAAQGKRRGAAPAAGGSEYWAGVTAGQGAARKAFFAAQSERRGAAADGGSDYWAGVTDDRDAEREAFFAAQSKRRAEAPKKIPGSRFWLNTTDGQRSDRDKFFAEQKAKLAARKAQKPGTGSNNWLGITQKKYADREAFFTAQKAKLLLPDTTKAGSAFFTNVKPEQRAQRTEFFEKQGEARTDNKSAFTAAVRKANLKAAALTSTSDQWTTSTVFNYHVLVAGIGIFVGSFRRISGLGTDEWQYETYREGGDNGPEHILLNNMKNGRVVFEWALRHPDPFLIWWLATGTGVILAEPVVVSLLYKGAPRTIWTIPQAMVVKIEAPELDAMNSEVATNKVELVHNGIITVQI